MNVPSSSTPGIGGIHAHSCRTSPVAFRMVRLRRLSRRYLFRGSVTRPAHSPSYASPRRSPVAAQGLDFPGVDSSRGRTCLSRLSLLWLTYLLLPVCAGAPTPVFGAPYSRARERTPSVTTSKSSALRKPPPRAPRGAARARNWTSSNEQRRLARIAVKREMKKCRAK